MRYFTLFSLWPPFFFIISFFFVLNDFSAHFHIYLIIALIYSHEREEVMKLGAVSPKGESLPPSLASEKNSDVVDQKIKTCALLSLRSDTNSVVLFTLLSFW